MALALPFSPAQPCAALPSSALPIWPCPVPKYACPALPCSALPPCPTLLTHTNLQAPVSVVSGTTAELGALCPNFGLCERDDRDVSFGIFEARPSAEAAEGPCLTLYGPDAVHC